MEIGTHEELSSSIQLLEVVRSKQIRGARKGVVRVIWACMIWCNTKRRKITQELKLNKEGRNQESRREEQMYTIYFTSTKKKKKKKLDESLLLLNRGQYENQPHKKN
jgi:hypothetical protein